ncbi:MAG: hypothetical protein DHS20C08_04650 [Rhodomicrobium sp.]|nr:MAG: hypothetical protein DHS20C08_04650 [Rhodomicrobium sp.]
MAAPVDSTAALCNRFLTRIGANEISSLDQESKEARVCKANFEYLRDDVNSAHAWGFALKLGTLAQSASSPEWGATYQYAIPTDLLGFITSKGEIQGLEEPYRIVGDYIVTNAATVQIEYVSRVENLNKWTPQAREALISRMQAELASGLTGSSGGVKAYWDMYIEKLSIAGAYNGAESTPREFIVDTWLSSRSGHITSYGGIKVSDF